MPEVWVTNRSERAVFLLGGEILSGARQDRIVRRTSWWLPGGRSWPSRCTAWSRGAGTSTTGSFGSEKNLGTYKLRAKAQAGGPDGQSEVWAEVAQANDQAGVRSSTGAYQDAYRDGRVARRVEELERGLADLARSQPLAVGAVVGLGDRLVSLDLFGDPALFRELWPKILKSTALAADGRQARVTRGQAAELLARLARADYLAVHDRGPGRRPGCRGWALGGGRPGPRGRAPAPGGLPAGRPGARWESSRAGALRKPSRAWEDERCEELPMNRRLGWLFALAVILPSALLAGLAVRAIRREEAFIEKQLAAGLGAEVLQLAASVSEELRRVEETLARGAPASGRERLRGLEEGLLPWWACPSC